MGLHARSQALLFGSDVHAQAVPMHSVKVRRCVWGGAQRLIIGLAVGIIGVERL